VRSVGIRELKTHLSRYLKDVSGGTSLAVTERGRIIAIVSPAGERATTPELAWAGRLAAEGKASWSGGKPRGLKGDTRPATKASVADAVIEDRR
jgi:prevent-host-death family protein